MIPHPSNIRCPRSSGRRRCLLDRLFTGDWATMPRLLLPGRQLANNRSHPGMEALPYASPSSFRREVETELVGLVDLNVMSGSLVLGVVLCEEVHVLTLTVTGRRAVADWSSGSGKRASE
jgi:hypothetical protein